MEYKNPNIDPKTAQKLSSIERQFIFMRANGDSIRDIAKKMKKSTRTVCGLNKKYSTHIFNIRNAQFSELQKKVIDLKSVRLNFLKNLIEKVIKILNNDEYLAEEPDWKFNDTLQIFIRLSELMSACEQDLLSVGTNFKENLQPESNDLLENEIDVYENLAGRETNVSDVSEMGNNVFVKTNREVIENKEVNRGGKQRTTKYNIGKRKKSKNKNS